MKTLQFIERISKDIVNEAIAFVRMLPGGLVFLVDRKTRIQVLDLETRRVESYCSIKEAEQDIRSLRQVLLCRGTLLLYFTDEEKVSDPVIMILSLKKTPRDQSRYTIIKRSNIDSIFVSKDRFILKEGDDYYEITDHSENPVDDIPLPEYGGRGINQNEYNFPKELENYGHYSACEFQDKVVIGCDGWLAMCQIPE